MSDLGATTAPCRPPWRVRLRVMLAAFLVLGTGAGSSLALWTAKADATASFQAAVVPAPTLTQPCTFQGGILGVNARVRIFWALPAGCTLNDVQVRASTCGLGSVLAPITGFSLQNNSQRQPNGTYRTEVPTNLLGGLLGLGTELEIAIILAPASAGGWTSRPDSVASNAGLIGGIGGNCRNLT